MTLLDSKGHPYSPTEEDVLWLMRAVSAEGPPSELVAQTLVNGFMWARDRAGWNTGLGSWVQAYAQPVNPRWLVGGDLYAKRLSEAKTPEERAELAQKASRRPLIRTRAIFDAETRSAVSKALARAPQYSDATDYAAPYVVRQPPWEARTPAIAGRNRLWSRPAAINWPGYRVDGVIAPNLGVVLLAITTGLYLLSRA